MQARFLFMIGACALLCAGAAAAAAAAGQRSSEMALELRSSAHIAHPRIVLGDVAVIDTANADAARLAAVELGIAPRVGYVERLTRAQIGQALRRLARVETVAWSGADSVTVAAQSQLIAADQLGAVAVDAVLSEFGAAHPGLQVSAATQPPVLEVPVGAVELRARRIGGTALAKRMSQWVDVLVNGAVYRSAVVQLAITQQRKVYVARRALEQGAWAGAADFTVADADVAGSAAVAVQPSLHDFRLRAALKEGQLLTEGAMLDGGKILRGDHVRLVVSRGQIGIETVAVAMADAAPGQIVAVRPAGAGEIVNGRVGTAGTVIIE